MLSLALGLDFCSRKPFQSGMLWKMTNTVRPRLSELRLTGIPAIRHKTARDGFIPMHFTPSIRKSRCPTPTPKFRNGYVKSIENKPLNQIMLTFT